MSAGKKAFLIELDWLIRAGKEDVAISAIHSSNYQDDVAVMKLLAQAYIRLEEWQLALATFDDLRQRSLKRQDEDEILYHVAVLLNRQGEHDKANHILRKLNKNDGRNAQVLCELGISCNDPERARSFVERSLRNARKVRNEYARAQVYHHASSFYEGLEEFEDAIYCVRQVLRIFPIHRESLIRLADLLLTDGQYRQAREAYLKAQVYYPDEKDALQEYVASQLQNLNEEPAE